MVGFRRSWRVRKNGLKQFFMFNRLFDLGYASFAFVSVVTGLNFLFHVSKVLLKQFQSPSSKKKGGGAKKIPSQC